MNTHDIELPTWHEAERNCLRNTDAPIDRFIFDNEPSECDAEWRQQLAAVIQAAIELDRQGRGEPVGYIHPDNAHRLQNGDTVAFRQRPYDGEKQIPVYLAPQPAEPVASGLTALERQAIEGLVAVAYAAFCTADDSEDDGSDTNKVSKTTMKQLNEALDKLDGLPDDQPGYVMEPAAKSRWALRRLLSEQPAEPVKCQSADMGEHACTNRAQCWEPCGELGNSAEHARVAEPVKEPSADEIADIVRDHLTAAYVCNRVWEAWSVGTMSQDDFIEASETEMADEIAAAIVERYGQHARPAASAAHIGEVHPDTVVYGLRQGRPTLLYPVGYFEAGGVKVYAAPVAAQPSAPDDDLIEWLETEVSAISCRYHGDPSYDHDAYWMRDKVLELLGHARKAFLPIPPATEQAQQDDKSDWCRIKGCSHKNAGSPVWETQPAQQDADNAPRLYQHVDGRYGLSFGPAQFAVNVPEWYSVPIYVVEDGQQGGQS